MVMHDQNDMYGCGGALPADRGTTADPPVPPRPCGTTMPPLARYTTVAVQSESKMTTQIESVKIVKIVSKVGSQFYIH